MIDTIKVRHSYRGKYKDTKIPRNNLVKIMEAGIAAPSGCNKQTTSFIAIDDETVLDRIKSVIDPPVKKSFAERAWFNAFGEASDCHR